MSKNKYKQNENYPNGYSQSTSNRDNFQRSKPSNRDRIEPADINIKMNLDKEGKYLFIFIETIQRGNYNLESDNKDDNIYIDESLASIKEKEDEFNPNNYQSYFHRYIQVVGKHNFSDDFNKIYPTGQNPLNKSGENQNFYNTMNFANSTSQRNKNGEIAAENRISAPVMHKPIVINI